MKKLIQLFLIFVSGTLFYAQSSDSDEKLWSSISKLTVEDFYITTDDTANPIKSQVSLSWQLMGFSVLNNNFNKNVTNKFIRSASIINPKIANVEKLLYYQQMNFDMAEVYARKMRKDLFVHKSKLWKAFDFATEVLNENLNEYYKVQLLMDRDTGGGTDFERGQFWKNMIDTELNNSKQFDYEATAKIKIDKTSESSTQKVWF